MTPGRTRPASHATTPRSSRARRVHRYCRRPGVAGDDERYAAFLDASARDCGGRVRVRGSRRARATTSVTRTSSRRSSASTTGRSGSPSSATTRARPTIRPAGDHGPEVLGFPRRCALPARHQFSEPTSGRARTRSGGRRRWSSWRFVDEWAPAEPPSTIISDAPLISDALSPPPLPTTGLRPRGHGRDRGDASWAFSLARGDLDRHPTRADGDAMRLRNRFGWIMPRAPDDPSPTSPAARTRARLARWDASCRSRATTIKIGTRTETRVATRTTPRDAPSCFRARLRSREDGPLEIVRASHRVAGELGQARDALLSARRERTSVRASARRGSRCATARGWSWSWTIGVGTGV